MPEQWKDIPGYEGLYQISNMGKVKRIAHSNCTYVGRILKSDTTRKGYKVVYLCANGHKKTRSIHQLVLEAFVGPKPSPSHVSRHLNGNPADNTINNLVWGTAKQNVEDAFFHGTRFQPRGSQCGSAKLTENQVLQIKRLLLHEKYTQRMIALIFNVCESSISQIKLNKTWRHVDVQ